MKMAHDSETQAYGEQVITACAFIHHSFDGVTKVFLPKRAATKKFLPGVHELPGGFSPFKHPRKPIHRGIGVASPHTLDEC